MSLPVRKPADDTTSIIRQDGQYTLAITPRPVLRRIDGQQSMKILGVPYGSLPRLILIHLMTEAVRNSSPHIVLGKSFTDWLRRLGLKTMSYGPRGSATLVREQLDRLLACEWVIRWDNQNAAGEQEFAVKEVKLTTDYAGVDGRQGSFSRELVLTQAFYEHLRAHAVPLDENAICQLRDSATAIDLYTWLAYRLPRVSTGRPTSLSWSQLASHFGNEGSNIRKFRQTIRDAWDRHVSAVYPEAKVEFDTSAVKLHSSPAPLQRRPLRLAVSNPSRAEAAPVAIAFGYMEFMAALKSALGPINTRSWLSDVTSDSTGDTFVLLFPTAFKVDYVRQNFASELRRAADIAGLSDVPELMHRSRSPAKLKS